MLVVVLCTEYKDTVLLHAEFPHVTFSDLRCGDSALFTAHFPLLESFAEFIADASERYNVTVSSFTTSSYATGGDFGILKNTLLVELS